MIDKIEAIVLFVQDLAACTAFYRDTFKLNYQGSDADSSSFRLQEGLYLILLSPSGTADLLGMPYNAKIVGGSHGLVAASVADVDAAYEELKAKGVTFVRPPTDQRWGLRTAHFADPEGNQTHQGLRLRHWPQPDPPPVLTIRLASPRDMHWPRSVSTDGTRRCSNFYTIAHP